MSTLTQATEVLPTGTWQLDPVHSDIGFEVDYLAGTFRGTFSPFEATLEVDGTGTPKLVGRAAVESVQVKDENLTAHLLTPDFFDAERAPEITFTSTSVERVGGDVEIDGQLGIKGRSQPVRLAGTIGGPVTDPYGRERLNLQLETTIDRREFGLDWNVELPSGEPALANEVRLTAELALVKD